MKVRYLICGIIFALAGITTAAPLLNIFGEGVASPADSEISSRIYENDTTSYVKVDELYDDASGKMNATNVDTLLKYITGNANASVSDPTTMQTLENLALDNTTSSDIRAKVVSENVTTPKSSSQDVIVTLGGLDWQVVYLSKDNNGNNILTLWLSSSYQDEFLNRSSTEGSYYGYLNGSLYSDWASNWSSSSTSVNYPSNMYGTSYIRAVTLNNGGTYATSTSASTTAEQNLDSVFARFTMEEAGNSLTSFLVTPNDVSWQLLQSSPENNPSESYLYPNDSLNDPTGIFEGNYYSTSYNYHSKNGYGAWANDYIWLPSMAETGYDSSNLGLWETSTAQRRNISSSTSSVGNVGLTSGSARPYSWLRSGTYSDALYASFLLPSGSFYSNLNVSSSSAVRPALHLNLNSVALSATSGAGGAPASRDIAYASVQSPELPFTGEPIEPELEVTYGGELLVKDEDYTIQFSNNTAQGQATVEITGINDYTGTKLSEFTIGNGYAMYFDIQLLEDSVEWAGDQTPAPEYTIGTYYGQTLEEDVDYSVTIPDPVLGSNNIVFTGMGSYVGTKTLTFTVTRRDISKQNRIQVSGLDELTYTGSALTPEFTVTDTELDMQLQSGTHFTYQFSNNTNAGTAYVTVRGTGNFTGTLQQAFTILPKELEYSMLGELGTYSYTGFDVEPEVVLTYNNMPLEKDIDFSVSYSNNLNASDNALITISAVDNGNYSGSIEATFSITRLSLENAQVGGYLAEYDFNDTEIKPEFSITVAGYFEEDQETLKTLVNGVDFEVQWPDDCKNVGVKEVTIIGINNFSYLTSVEFEIVATNIESLTIEGFEESLPYNHGDGVTQNLVLKLGDNVIGSENYVISYQNNINAGETAELYITPSNANLTGEISRTFDIEKAAPVLNFVENLSGFDGDNLNELTVLGEGCTEGVLTFEQDSLMLGTTTYNYTFTPTDTENYEITTGSIEIQVNTVELVDIEAESGRLVSGNVFDTSFVRVFGLYNNGARLEIQITECEVSIPSGSTLAYGQNVTIRYAGFDTTLVVLRDSIQNNGFTVSSDIGIDEGVEFEVEIVDDLIGIYEIIGEYYENYGNVEQIFVTTLTKDGEAYTDDRLVVTFDTATVQGNFVYYSLEDGKLVQLDVSGGTINFGSDGNIILALEVYSDFTMWIIIGAICLFALIIVVFVILLALRNRKKKRKKMSTSSNADSENFEEK